MEEINAPPVPQRAAQMACEAVTDDKASAASWPVFDSLPKWLQCELRSDHAGEYGAVMIYRGVLAMSRDAAVQQFAERHLQTEQRHLSLMQEIIPKSGRTRLLPLWHVMGWLTGALPSLFGRSAVFSTIEAVETFVDHHYQQQIDRLNATGEYPMLKQTLSDCQADEVSHRDEAAQLAAQYPSALMRIWCAIVGAGSAVAVVAARRI
ncbi:MAG: demethoxyubiquinone hydroxylase family protein [Luminiphilus sp.]|nr:demethoxyubiquinone hydroxylase family protein [Luminiphilus sp.]